MGVRHRRWTAIRLAAGIGVAIVGILGAWPGSVGAKTHEEPGIGSSVALWQRAYGESSGPGTPCATHNSCFGRIVHNADNGRTYVFTAVTVTARVITGFTESFPKNTTATTALAEIMRTMPRNATRTPVIVDPNGGSCGMFNVTSPTLGKEPQVGDPQGVVGVELLHNGANGKPVYSTTNVQTATLVAAATNPADDC